MKLRLKRIKIAFLLGAGISINQGAPTTEELTKKILNNSNVGRHTNGIYYSDFKDAANFDNEPIGLIQNFLKKIKSKIEDYYEDLDKSNFNPVKMVNYESIYFYIWQILNSKNKEWDNPITLTTQKTLEREFNSLKKEIKYSNYYNFNFNEFLGEITKYISAIVSDSLCIKINNYNNFLNYVFDSANDDNVLKVEIFTLNHDTLIEQSLENKHLLFTDGYNYYNSELGLWDLSLFNKKQFKINLYKLHGSIDWYNFGFKDKFNKRSKWITGRAKIGADIDHFIDKRGNIIDLSSDEKPIILIGTFNKMFKYQTGVFIELFYKFYEVLNTVNFLIVSGYSFNDKGINFYIKRFLDNNFKNRLIVINKEPEILIGNSRGIIKNSWYRWIIEKKIKVIRNNFEEVEWNLDYIVN